MIGRDALACNQKLVKAVNNRGLVDSPRLFVIAAIISLRTHAKQLVHFFVGEQLGLVRPFYQRCVLSLLSL